jgi:hypothetical protein
MEQQNFRLIERYTGNYLRRNTIAAAAVNALLTYDAFNKSNTDARCKGLGPQRKPECAKTHHPSLLWRMRNIHD